MKNYTRHIILSVIIMALNIFYAKAAGTYTKTLSSGTTTIEFNTTSGSSFTVTENGGSASEPYTLLGDITITGGTHTINFNTTGIIYSGGTIKVTGGTLNIILGEKHTSGSVIKRFDGNNGVPAFKGALFHVENSSNDINDCKLYINGNSSSIFTIHGYGDFNVPSGNIIDGYPNEPELTNDGNGKVVSTEALIIIRAGYVELNRVKLNRNYNGSGYGSSSGGAVNFYNVGNSGAILKMKDCDIEKCYTKKSGGAIYIYSSIENGGSYVDMENCEINDCFTYGDFDNPNSTTGGTIRTIGSSFATLRMKNCKIHDNISDNGSGGISWNAGRALPAEFNGCEIYGNQGGGIGLSSSANIVSCKIHDNIARGSGGGLSFGTYSSNTEIEGFKPYNTNLILDSNTEIYNNEAQNGGGIYFAIKPMIINSTGDNPWTVIYNNEDKPYETSLSIEGAKVYNNKSRTVGGGLYFLKKADTPPEYLTDLNLKYGEIYENEASNGDGGGFYVEGQISISIGDPSRQISFYDNTASGNGGAFYIENGNVSMANGQIGKEGKPNIAKGGDGGAIFMNNGSISIEGGVISDNEATRNGGGIFMNNGSISIKGGVISDNEATRNGGGIYSNGGQITINNGAILSNGAVNGGGGYVKGGTLTINNGDIDSNTATDGAGFFVDGGTLNLYGGTIGKTNGNVASNKGGGFYIKGGQTNIKKAPGSSTSSIVQFNEAKYGAGLYVEGTAASGANHAQVDFENGAIKSNHAEEAGGGIYISQYATLTMTGSSEVTDNYVDQPGKGGGVYKTGETSSVISVSGNSLKITDNYVENEDSSHTVNNLFLYGPMDFLTVAGSENLTGDIAVGISIDEQTKPLDTRVIHGEFRVLNDIFTKMKSEFDGGEQSSFITDDAHKYLPLFSGKPAPYTFDYIFFVKVCYSDYPTVPASYKDVNPLYIHNAEELAYFTMIVNGINLEEGGVNKNPSLEAYLENDIVITETFGKWIPAGGFQQTGNAQYTGKFHGQGHTISGLYTAGLPDINEYGLFGVTSGAVIEDLNLTDLDIKSGESMHSALLIGEMNGGVVRNVVASGLLDVCGSGESSDGSGNSIIGGLVGELKNGGSIINSMAMAEINADFMSADLANMYDYDSRTVGGLVGVITNGTVRNSFANPKIIHGSWNPRYVGGLVGENGGTIQNCYVRLDRGIALNQPYNGVVGQPGYQEGYVPTDNHSKFGMFAGRNDGTIEHCFYPESSLRNIMVGSTSTPEQSLINEGNNPATYGEYNTTVTPYYYKHNDNLVTMDGESAPSGSLLAKLNKWVEDANTAKGDSDYSTWMRTSASPANGDYPVLTFDNLDGTLDYTTVGSKDGIQFEYGHSVNTMIERFNGYAAGGSLYVYKTPGENTSEDFVAEKIDKANNANVALYIKEDVALNNTVSLPSTYVGITLDNSAGANGANPYAGGTDAIDWHMFATPLEGAPLGINYNGDTEAWPFSFGHAEGMPEYSFYSESDKDGYFPSKTFGTNADYYHDWDFYTYDEPSYHWINFKRNKLSHWHEDVGYGVDASIPENHEHIDYTGTEYESGLQRGKGYLLAAKSSTFLQSHGTLKTGNLEGYTLTASASEETGCKGYNLIGNPYQSYLDFDVFAGKNNEGIVNAEDKISSYIILDEDAKGYVSYAVDGSVNCYPSAEGDGPAEGYKAPTNLINMHQGFFVVANSQRTVKFNNDMRKFTADENTHFRGTDRPAYPLVNLVVTEENGNRDYLTVELDRPDTGGAVKMKGIRMGTSQIYTHCGDEDYAIAFMPCGTTAVPVRFETTEAGTFSLCWNTCNGTFSYLHLIDNMAGVDIDCLASDEYRFTASPTDYTSRFRLVFSYTGVEEDEAASASSASFAFMHDGNLIVNGKGMLEVIDMNGRTVASKRLGDAQNTVGLPRMAQGVYVLKLTNDNQSKVQKIVID